MLLSVEELAATAQPHPQVADFYAKQPPVKVDYSDHTQSRAGLAAASKAVLQALGPAPPDLSEVYHDIPMRDGYTSSVKIQRPASGPAGPLFVLFFGGGFVGGDKDQLSGIGRILVTLFGATVVLPDYRLAPEYKFPVAHLDGWDATIWAAANATGSLLNADPAKGFIIGGVSAGGCISGALSRKFQEHKLAHPLTGQWLCIPSLMDKESCPEKYRAHYVAFEQNRDAPGLSEASREMMIRAAEFDTTSDLRYAALSKTSISEQPRTYFQVTGMDPLRDDALIYEEMLKDAGVPTKLDFYPGCPHAHFMSMRGIEIANRANIDMFVGFAWLLQSKVARADVTKLLKIETVP